MILEDQYKNACDELAEKKAHLLKVTPTEKQMTRDSIQCKALENQLDKCLVKYNSIQSENKLLRQKIDVMRKEQKNQTRVNVVYGKELKITGEKAKKINTTSFQGQRVSEET